MKRKSKQWWSTIPPNLSTKRTTTYHRTSLNTKMTNAMKMLGTGNPCPGLGQAPKCGRVKPFNYILALSISINQSTCMNKFGSNHVCCFREDIFHYGFYFNCLLKWWPIFNFLIKIKCKIEKKKKKLWRWPYKE